MRILSPEEKERLRENTAINKEKMWQAKLQPCSDCGLRWHPHTMTFDHIGRSAKTKNKNAKTLASLVYYNPILFQRMLNGCSVVCRNCHNIRELKRDMHDVKVSKYRKEEMSEYLKQCTAGALLSKLRASSKKKKGEKNEPNQ